MAAIFMRNRYIGWAAFVYSVQSWLGESEDAKKSSTPGYFSVGMSRKYGFCMLWGYGRGCR